jgi:hypothetical protein
MVEHIENEVKNAIKIVIQNAKFISLTCHEITFMDNASWASVHACIV